MENLETSGAQAGLQPIERPTAVTVFGILNCVFGGIGMMCAPAGVLLIPLMEKQMQVTSGDKMWMLVSGIVGFIFSAWLLTMGIGLLMFKGWARMGSIVYACFYIPWILLTAILNFIDMSQQFASNPEAVPGYIGGACGGILGLIYPVLLLIFMNTAKVKQAFAQLEARRF